LGSFEGAVAKKVVLKASSMSKGKKTKNKKEPKANAKPPETAEDRPDEGNTGNMDFGGIPARDLKKNLGCG
jgi:hypothetical protein